MSSFYLDYKVWEIECDSLSSSTLYSVGIESNFLNTNFANIEIENFLTN